jgi:hypothetical protein
VKTSQNGLDPDISDWKGFRTPVRDYAKAGRCRKVQIATYTEVHHDTDIAVRQREPFQKLIQSRSDGWTKGCSKF